MADLGSARATSYHRSYSNEDSKESSSAGGGYLLVRNPATFFNKEEAVKGVVKEALLDHEDACITDCTVGIKYSIVELDNSRG